MICWEEYLVKKRGGKETLSHRNVTCGAGCLPSAPGSSLVKNSGRDS